MEITENVIPHIERALHIKLYEDQKRYLLKTPPFFTGGGRRTGKTLVYCIKLALSEGEPLDMKSSWEFSDFGDGSKRYALGFFRGEFMRIREQLSDYGFRVREVKFK